jgi:cellulose synthase (UDP-forming)
MVKGWLDSYYMFPVVGTVTATLLVLLLLSVWLTTHRKLILSALLFLCAQYMLWRGVYTLNTNSLAGTLISGTVYLAELYNLVHIGIFVYQSWEPLERTVPPLRRTPTVDILVPIVNEPLFILERTLVGCLAQDYPRERVQVHVLDDGRRDEVRQLALSLGCRYLRRPDSGAQAKAGNLNHAIARSRGEYVAVFDTDHVPVRSFLKETLPYFDDPKVGMVQTAHHFYNRDIFQRTLRLQNMFQDEQRLFFRILQPGRNRHNSAFFAGSSGLFRRSALADIGGVRPETITEDLHTSLLVHAKGYRSCYVNRVLSAGLMPETLAGYLKQRMRWATGAIQLLFHANPLTISGLTLAQRADYLGAVHYFLFGFPRIVCLVAPLPWLYFDIPVLRADPLTLILFFFSYFLASLLTIRAVTKGMRSPLWSDIYETMLCFAVTKAVFGTFLAPGRPRPFVVTPKGELMTRPPLLNRLVRPHLILFGLLAVGLVIGTTRASAWGISSGMMLCLFWAGANLLLLGATISTAHETPLRQQYVRVPFRVPCEILVRHRCVRGTTVDLSEQGALVTVPEPIEAPSEGLTVRLQPAMEPALSLRGWVVRQESERTHRCHVGLQFAEMSAETRHTLIRLMFGSHLAWPVSEPARPGLWFSLKGILKGILAAYAPLKPSRRRTPRLSYRQTCRLQTGEGEAEGILRDISYTGLSLWTTMSYTQIPSIALLRFGAITLKVRPRRSVQEKEGWLLMCSIESVEQEEADWAALFRDCWHKHSSGSMPQPAC